MFLVQIEYMIVGEIRRVKEILATDPCELMRVKAS